MTSSRANGDHPDDGRGPAAAVGAGLDNIRQVRAETPGNPASAERRVAGVHSQVAHAPVLAVELDHPLPIDWLVRV